MPDSVTAPAETPVVEPLTDAELRRLSRWAQRSTLPAWPTFDPSMASTPPDTIMRLVGERNALRAVLETIGEFNGNVAEVMKRMGIE
jgi:hypothetical protein